MSEDLNPAGDPFHAPLVAAALASLVCDQLHVIERYKLIDGGKMMEVVISVDDPGALTTPWSAMQRFRRVPHEWSEDICAENNFDFLQYEVVPLPQASKSDF